MSIIRPDQFNPPHKGNSQRASQGFGRFYMSAPGLNQGELPSGGDPAGVAPTIVWDGWESANMSAPTGPSPYLNTTGFTWGSNNQTSVVTMNPDPVAVWNNGLINNPDADTSKDWTAKTGTYCLRFRFNVAAGEVLAEQRFNIGTAQPDIWMSFWLRVPTNFNHLTGNQKLFRLWMDAYTGDGSKVGMEFRPDGSGGSYFYLKQSEGDFTGVGGDLGGTEFIVVPRDLGRWMNIVFHAKVQSAPAASDGVLEVWRKWEDEASYTKTHNYTDRLIKLPDTGPQGFFDGYLMGSGDSYGEETEFLMDDFKLSTTSLLE